MLVSKILNTFMYDHTLQSKRKTFCRYCLQAFNTVEMLTLFRMSFFGTVYGREGGQKGPPL